MRSPFSYIKSFIFIIGVLCSSVIIAQDFSNKGTDFWVVYSGHIDALSSRMALYITSDVNTSGTVSVNGVSTNFNVIANQVSTVQLTSATSPSNFDAYLTNSNLTQFEVIGINKGIHIVSQNPVVVYSHILNSARSGSTLVLPTKVLGREYVVASYKSTGNIVGTTGNNASQQHNSEFNIIATEDSTNVEITPTNSDYNKRHPANVTFDTLLNKGDVYQFQSFEDLTGTKIKSIATSTSSCKRIAVYSGSTWTSMGCSNATSGDNLYQQLFPTSSWGKHYFTSPSINRGYDIFRILVQDTSTVVYINGKALDKNLLINNSFYELSTSGNNTYREITGDKPICVLQYFITMNCDNKSSGDPEMIVLNPIEQTLSDITVMSARRDLTPPNTNITSHYLNIIFKSSAFNSLKIDGASPNATPNVMGTTGYSFIQEDVTYSTNYTASPSHRIICDSGFICIAYGFGNVESYGYNAGANVKDLYQTLSINNQFAIENNPITCKGSPFKAAITLPYKPLSLKWKVQDYNDFFQNAPIPLDSFLVNSKKIYKYILDTNIIYNSVGTFNFQVIANNPTTDGCSGEQEINFDLIVIAPPNGNFNYITTNCIQDSISLSDNTPVGDKPVYKYFWDLGNAKFIDTIPILKFKPNREGEFNIRYVVANTIGCLSDTISKLIKIDSAINVNFNISKITCQNKDIEFFDLSKARGISQMQNWFWDYGDGSKVDTMTASTKMKHQYTNLQTYNPILTVQTLNGCINSYTLPIVINPSPQINVILPEVCLADAAAKFIDATTIADNSTNKFSYLWNFNDSSKKDFPNPTLLIPNALTAKNPEVKYLSPGKYVVSLRVVQDDTKCVDSARFSFTVNGSYPKPLFYILKDTALCSNEFVEIRDSSWVDIGSIGKLNIYWGDGSDTTVEDPSLNKVYKHFYKNINAPNNLNLNYTIKINASSGGVCQSAISNALSIVPPPEFPIITTIKDYLCKSDTLLLNVLSKGGAPPFVNNWTSENSNASIDNTKSLIYGLIPGQVQVSLKVMDSKKCVYPYPSLAFFNTMLVRDIPTAEILPGDSIICNGDAINIAGAGRGYDNSPINTYSWYRNDTLISTLSTNSITNNIPGWYKLTVNDGKCNSVATPGKKVWPLNITKYNFSHLPNICIGVPLIVTTNAVDQYNVHYNWDFGDGFNYLKANPGSHKYMAKGDYKIKLNVTNDYCPKYEYQLIGNTIKVASAVKPTTFKYFFLAKQPFNVVTKTDPGYVQYKWNPATFLDNPNKPNPIFNGDKSTDYTLTRTDTITSCSVTDEYEIIVSTEVYANVPNAFTPNNDGLNDVLKVQYSAGVGAEFNFRIFNRWGKLLFQTSDINKGWDGRDLTGILQEMDGYSYLLEYNYIDPLSQELKNIKKTGSVILFR